MNKANFLVWTMMAFCAAPLHAASPADEVIVIYNTKVPESKGVADYYAQKRHIPSDQVFGFALSTGDDMSRTEFTESLEKPLAKKLEDKFWRIRSEIIRATTNQPGMVVWKPVSTRIRYAVLCYGVPYRIKPEEGLKESKVGEMRPELRRNEAAVDSELALLPTIEQHLPLTGPLANPLYSSTNEFSFSPTNGVLMVTRLDGPTASIARGLVDKALEAEANGLWGRAYIDMRNIADTNYAIGDNWMRGAAEICRHLGFETVVDNNPGTFPVEFPMSQIAFYAGWYDGEVSGPFTRPQVEFMPGAFAYHLHSYSAANLRSPSQNWVGPLLAKGATITMGCVAEPYLGGTPEVAIFASRMIYYGFNFGEAAYASQPVLSWQTTVVGDPLYRPFGKPAQQLHDELNEKHSKLAEWSFLRLANLNLASGRPPLQVATLIESIPLTKESSVLTEKLADLYSTLGKPASAIETWERALKLDPTPQQEVRIRLAIGDKLIAADRHADAAEVFAKLLQDQPDYPAKAAIYRKLQSIAQKLGRDEAAASYEQKAKELTPASK